MTKENKAQLAFIIDEVIGLRKKTEVLDALLWLLLALSTTIMLCCLQLVSMDSGADWLFVLLLAPAVFLQVFLACYVWKLKKK